MISLPSPTLSSLIVFGIQPCSSTSAGPGLHKTISFEVHGIPNTFRQFLIMSHNIRDRLIEQLEGFLIPLEKEIQEEIRKPGRNTELLTELRTERDSLQQRLNRLILEDWSKIALTVSHWLENSNSAISVSNETVSA